MWLVRGIQKGLEFEGKESVQQRETGGSKGVSGSLVSRVDTWT